MKIVSIILARSGSKGIPNKNIIKLNNKPLISYAITASVKSKVHETWVSSDSNKILNIAKKFKANTLLRPKKYSTDKATSESALIHFASKVNFDIMVFIQATSPLIIPQDINKSLVLLKKYDSVISVSKLDQFVWNNKKPNYDLNNRQRRQNNNQSYLETGSIFVTKRENFLASKNRISGKIGFVEVPRSRSFDIDTYEDLNIVKKIIK